MTSIVHSLDPITLIGGGEVGPADLNFALGLAPVCVAADGGASVAVAAGINLHAVIGDFDSVDDAVSVGSDAHVGCSCGSSMCDFGRD